MLRVLLVSAALLGEALGSISVTKGRDEPHVVDGMIVFPHCDGSISVQSVNGNFTVPCNRLKYTKLFGPLIVTTEWARYFLENDNFYSEMVPDSSDKLKPCRGKTAHYVALILVLDLVLSLSLWMVLRYIWMTRVSNAKGYRILTKKGHIFHFEMELEKKPYDGSIRYVRRDKPKVTIDSPSIRTRKYTTISTILAVLFFIHPSMTAPSSTLLGASQMGPHYYKILVGQEYYISINQVP